MIQFVKTDSNWPSPILPREPQQITFHDNTTAKIREIIWAENMEGLILIMRKWRSFVSSPRELAHADNSWVVLEMETNH